MNREQIETDVVCVGAGVASLATVLRLMAHARKAGLAAPRVMVLEKGRYVGAHALSGAVLDTAPLAELLTPEQRARMPVLCHVVNERFYRLTSRHALPIPFVPPAMHAKGMPLISLSAFTKFLGELCEEAGAEIYTEMTAAELLEEHGRIVGVRIGDKGIDKDGTPKASFEPGPEVRAWFALGMPAGVMATGMGLLSGGLVPPRLRRRTTDAQHLRAANTPAQPSPSAQGDTDLDRLGDLFFSGTQHDEHQPCHLHIIDPERCRRECIAVYGAPCTRFCPAQVYTLAEDGEHIRIDAANCLHCKTCAIKDPLGNIEWRLPEGGGGPRYVGM